MKRQVDDEPAAWPTLIVRGRYLRVPDVSSWARKAVPKTETLDVSEWSFTADGATEWAATRIREKVHVYLIHAIRPNTILIHAPCAIRRHT
jgi:hypothetical protein